jgi:uncharacterized membrane protein YcaP (DUF421 family)
VHDDVGMVNLGYYAGIAPAAAAAVVLSTVTLYAVFTVLIRLGRRRLVASPSSLDVALVVVAGPLVGRASLGRVPTLSAGLIAVGTLLVVRSLVALVSRGKDVARSRHPAPALVVAGEVDHDALRRHGLTVESLWSALRERGVTDPGQVALAVLERTGRISVLRAGQAVHEDALTGVAGAELLTRLAAG